MNRLDVLFVADCFQYPRQSGQIQGNSSEEDVSAGLSMRVTPQGIMWVRHTLTR